ncbi:MAG: class I tRNA ligase family protein [Ignavibacteria bacterium]
MKRVTEVIDCWFDSGSMPFAHLHYPFENKELFENNYPLTLLLKQSIRHGDGSIQCLPSGLFFLISLLTKM